MNIFARLCLLLISLLGMATALVIFAMWVPAQGLTEFVNTYVLGYLQPGVAYYLIGFVVMLFAVFFIAFLISIFWPSSARHMSIRKPKGRIEISKKALESTAKYSVSDLVGANAIDIRARVHKHSSRPKIKAKVYMDEKDADYTGLAANIQQRIHDSIRTAIESPVKSVCVKMEDMASRRANAHRQLI